MMDPRAPLTPADSDLRDFPAMMLNIVRLRMSSFDAMGDDTAWRAGLNLWMSAFHGIPAGSLDDGEAELCKAAGLGRDVKAWRKVRAAGMRGWILCSDGRWYHETVAEVVLEAWIGKLAQRFASAAGTAARYKQPFDPKPFQEAMDAAALMLRALNPSSKAIPKASRRSYHATAAGSPDGITGGTPAGTADDVPSECQVEVEETVEGKESKKEDSCGPASRRPPDASPVFIELPTNRFETEGEEVPITEKFVEDFQKLFPAIDVQSELRKMRAWLITNRDLRKTRKGMTRFVNAWLGRQQDRVSRETSNGGRNGGRQNQSPNESFAAELIGSIHKDRVGESGLFDGGGEIIDVTPSNSQKRTHDEAA